MLAEAGEVLTCSVMWRPMRPRTAHESARPAPSSLLYTYGPGAIMDLPGFSVMPAGLGRLGSDLGTARTHSDDRGAATSAGGSHALG